MPLKIKINAVFLLITLLLIPDVQALETNQLHYRSAILLALPDGYHYSIEDILAPFKADPPSAPLSNPTIELVLRAERNLLSLAIADRHGDNEIPIAANIPLGQIRQSVDAYLNTLENKITKSPQSSRPPMKKY